MRTRPAILGTHYIINKLSGWALHSPASTNGTVLMQRGFTGNSNQKWVVAVDSGTDDYTIQTVSCGLVVDDYNSQSSRNPIDQWPADGQHRQVWLFIPCPDGFFKIQNYHSGMVMAVEGSSTSNGANIEQETDISAANQHWKLQN